MRVAYLYNRDFSEGEAMGAGVTFADYTKTNRQDLFDMLSADGIRAGDVVVVRAVGDFGQGAESKRIQRQIADLGATIEVLPGDEEKRVTGRPPKLEFKTIEDWESGCEIWYSPYPDSEAYKRIGRLVDGEVDKNWVNYRCGPRSAKNRDAKRAIMVARLKRNQE
jgi:hypothetical protein